tara:strand:- start:173 stop:403 length:231 start_codon:yes stop_codon:yes gene_type:complete
MKIIVEVLKVRVDPINDSNEYYVDKSLTKVIPDNDIANAKYIANILKNTSNKIRVIEYHNDESDDTRQPCKVLYEL